MSQDDIFRAKFINAATLSPDGKSIAYVPVSAGGELRIYKIALSGREGWILKPRHVRAPYKTLLCIHGGPHAGFGYSFNCDYHELVGAGYAVLTANPKGSTGYGDEFSTCIFGVWGTSDAGKKLIELEMGGELHKIPDTYWALSPLAYAHKCKTPTLLIQGEDDIRCPMEQAEQMYAALEHHGCEVELLRLKNCTHGAQVGGDPALRRYRMDAMKKWFGRCIK